MPFPVAGHYAQMQSNMAATLNIDWLLDLALGVLAAEGITRSRADLIGRLGTRGDDGCRRDRALSGHDGLRPRLGETISQREADARFGAGRALRADVPGLS